MMYESHKFQSYRKLTWSLTSGQLEVYIVVNFKAYEIS
jgi:hypothetical protein